MGYAVKVTTHAVEAVIGTDKSIGIVAAEATGIGRKRWGSIGGGDLHKRGGSRVLPQGTGWTVEGGSPYGSYAGTPVSNGFPSPTLSSYSTPGYNGSAPVSPNLNAPPPTKRASSGYAMGIGMGVSTPPAFGPSSHSAPAPSPYDPVGAVPAPPTPGAGGLYSHFPPTPNGASTFPPGVTGPGTQLRSGSVPDKTKKAD